MADYPGVPTYNPNHDDRNQLNIPFLPPYQNKLMQIDDNAFNYLRTTSICEADNLTSGIPSLPLYQGQNQGVIPLQPFLNSHNGPSYNFQNNFDFQNNTHPPLPVTQPAYSSGSKVFQTGNSNDYHSIGYENINGAMHKAASLSSPQFGLENLKDHFNNYSARATKENPQELDPTNRSELPRQQSDSYSPQVSPVRPDFEQQTTKIKQPKAIIPSLNVINGQSLNGSTNQSLDNKYSPNIYQVTQNVPEDKLINCQKSNQSGKSLNESRKKAGEAVLNLWSYGLRYQNYIQEGFKKELVDKLFEDLKLQKILVSDLAPLNVEGKTIMKPTMGVDPPSKETNLSLVPTISSSQAPTNGQTMALTKPSQMAEKEKTLQFKMEALRKSREARASAKTVAKTSNLLPSEKLTIENSKKPVNEGRSTAQIGKQEESNENQHTLSFVNSLPDKRSPSTIQQASQISIVSTTELRPDSNLPIIEPPPGKNKTAPAPQAIPGLFLVSNTTDSTRTQQPPTNISTNLRKRPVASDFDDASHSMTPFKRPFGHTRNEQRLVIEVSDDESEDEDVLIDPNIQNERASPENSSRKTSSISQNIQSSSNSPARKPCTPSPNPTSQLQSNPSKPSLSTPKILKQKQREIQLMKQRIALAEAQLKAKATISSCGTPQQSETGASDTKESFEQTNKPSIKDPAPSKTSPKIKADLGIPSKADNTHLRTQAKEMTELDWKNDEERRLLRERIANELPVVEAELLQGQSRLDQLRNEMAQIEATMKKNLDEKRRIADQIKLLELGSGDIQAVRKETLDSRNFDSEEALALDHRDINQSKSSSPEFGQLNPPASVDQSRNLIKDTECDQITTQSIQENIKLMPIHTDKLEDELSSRYEVDCTLQVTTQDHVRAEAKSHGETSNQIIDESFLLGRTTVDMADSSMEEGELNLCHSSQVAQGEGSEVESDNYEPPDATAPHEVPSLVSPPFSPAPPESMEEDMDGTKLVKVNSKQADVKNKEMLPQEKASVPQYLVEGPLAASNLFRGFIPYESPLKKFRAYRFHPNFNNEVSGGLRSITYSHKIDAKKEFCRFELAGGVCNDPTCDLQHFKSITLPDDGIMAALGCPDEFKGERREKYIIGLREVLLGLRLRKVTDFDLIASEIISHRARFLGDESKILALEGTNV